MMENELARIVWAQTWQLSLLIVVVAGICRLVGRNHPHLAYGLWVVVLVKAVTPPLWSSPGGVFSWLQIPRGSEEIIKQNEPIDVADPPGLTSVETPQRLPAKTSFDEEQFATPEIVTTKETSTHADLPPVEKPVVEKSQSTREPKVAKLPTARTKTKSKPAWPIWARLVLAVWLMGFLGSLLVAGIRWWACLREIRRSDRVDDPSAQELMKQLAARLKVRRRVRLVISRSRIGPAVLGIFCPKVFLPACVIEGKTSADLEPILAHELIHVRRGDLWVGWLQVLVQAAWWFHPLIWWAGRLVKHEAERCCDEEVVAELGLKPGRYARALLDVLELKQVLKPVPVLPGVKPVEITSQRLERIMLLRHGSRKRTPWWCWLVMLLTAATTLPGAAFVAQAKDKPNRKAREKQTTATSQTRRFKIGDVLERYQSEHKIQNETVARSTLAELLKNMVGEPWNEETLLTNGRQAATPSITIKGNTLRVRHTPRVLDRIAEELEILREHGFAQIMIEARIITAGRNVVEKMVSRWEVMPSEGPERAGLATKVDNGVRSTTEKSAPLRMAILEDPQFKKLIETCQSDARSNLMFCPKVTVFNGQHATIQDTVQRPFVVGISSDGKPTIRVVEEGTKIRLRAIWKGDHIRLESQVTLSDIRNVDVVNLPGKVGEESSPKVQVPEVATTRINNTVKLSSGGSVLLGGLKLPDKRRVPRGRGIVQSLSETIWPENAVLQLKDEADQQLFVMLRVVHLQDTSPDVEVRYAQKAAELAELEYQTALEANRRMKGTVPKLDVERLKLKAELAHLQVEQVKQELERKKAGTDGEPSPQTGPAEGELKAKQEKKATLLFFEADWCGPCQQMNPIVSRFKRQRYPVQRIDVDKERELARQFNVKSLPTFVLIVDGKEQKRRVGLQSEKQLRRMLAQTDVEKLSSLKELVEDYNAFVNAKRYREAEAVARKAKKAYPENPTVETMFWTLWNGRRDAQDDALKVEQKETSIWEQFTGVREGKKRSDNEETIAKALKQKLTLQFKDTPLDEVIQHVAKQAEINIVVNNLGLKEEGVKADHKVSIDVKDVTLASALKLILKPLHLDYVIEDEVLKITSKTRVDRKSLEVITYPVADLVVPIPNQVTVDLRKKTNHAKPKAVPELKSGEWKFEGRIPPKAAKQNRIDFDDLTKLITSTVEPDSWAEKGGNATIRPYETTLNLVIRQTHRAHQEIRDVLDQLRRLQDVQVSLQAQTIEVGDDLDSKLLKSLKAGKPVTVNGDELSEFVKTATKGGPLPNMTSQPKVTIFNGQLLSMILPAADKDGMKLEVSPVTSEDRRFVRLQLAVSSDPAEGQDHLSQHHLKDGQSLLLDVTKYHGDKSGKRQLLLIKPTIVVEEEEEELLGIDEKE